MNLDEVKIIRLQKFEACLHRMERAVAISRVDLGGEKNFLTPSFGKYAEPLFAQPFDAAPSIRPGGIEVIDARVKSLLEQRLRRVFAFDGTEARA